MTNFADKLELIIKTMYKTQGLKNSRIEVADALRGLAVIGIVIYHAVEHMNTSGPTPTLSFSWDNDFFHYLGVIVAGKAYGIFAILFGLSFFIQRDNQEQKGKDFSLRFLWRMFLLLIFGTINVAIFDGDILQAYAIIGVLLIPAGYLSNKWLWAITIFLLLQPLEIITYFTGWQVCGWDAAQWGVIGDAHINGSFWENCWVDLTVAPINNWVFYLLTGRATQTLGLFYLGLLFGRYRLFYNEGNNLKIWRIVFVVTLITTLVGNNIDLGFGAQRGEPSLSPILTPMMKAGQTLCYISGAVLMWYAFDWFKKAFKHICFFGRMSLTNYLMSSVLGSFIFYGWGLGMCLVLGTFWSFWVGVGIVVVQIIVLYQWDKHHQRGPLETLWRNLTWCW